jgi:hypothetical protein
VEASRNSPQCLHFIASSWISSAQKGHFFIIISLGRTSRIRRGYTPSPASVLFGYHYHSQTRRFFHLFVFSGTDRVFRSQYAFTFRLSLSRTRNP